MKRVKTRTLVNVAVLTAMQMVLTYLVAINTPITRIGFGFVPVALCAILYGPLWAIAVGLTSDILGSTLFSMGWFPPLSITAIMTALLFGVLINQKRNPRVLHTTVAAGINCFVLSLFLQTFLLTFLFTDKSFAALLPTRAVQACVMFPIQAVMLPILVKLGEMLNRHFRFVEVSDKA